MGCISGLLTLFFEWKIANQLAFPGYVIHFLDRLFWLVDYLYLGHHGRGNLASGILAMTVFNLALYFLEGLLSAQDIFIFQSKGYERIEKSWMYISSLYVLLCTFFVAGLFVVFDLYLYSAMEFRDNVLRKTVIYGLFLLPAFFFHGLQRILQQYFSIKGLYSPIMISMLLGVVSNVIGNSFMFYSTIGPLGVAVSTSIAKLLTVLLLVYFSNKHFNNADVLKDFKAVFRVVAKKGRVLCSSVLRSVQKKKAHGSAGNKKRGKSTRITPQEGLHHRDDDNHTLLHSEIEMHSTRRIKKAPKSLHLEDVEVDLSEEEASSSDELDETLDAAPLIDQSSNTAAEQQKQADKFVAETLANIVRYLIVGFPGAIMLAIDMWPYELAVFFVSQMGTIVLDTQQMLVITIQAIGMTFILPWATATTIRIQTALSQQRPDAAMYAAWNCVLQGLLVAAIFTLIGFAARSHLGYMYSNNTDLINRISTVSLFANFLIIPYMLQMCLKGVLRAVHYQMDVMLYYLVAVWMIGFPLGLFLCLYIRPSLGLEGLWIGLIVGLSLYCLPLLLQLFWLDWKQECRKFKYRTDQYNTHLQNNQLHGVYLNDITIPNIANISIGGFQIHPKTVDEEMDELMHTELVEGDPEEEMEVRNPMGEV